MNSSVKSDVKGSLKADKQPDAKIDVKRPKRSIPPYKMIWNTTFSMDAFSFGVIPNCTAYFLSHFHSDHYMGLTSKFNHGPIYCTSITAALLIQELNVDPSMIVSLPLEIPTVVQGITVTLIDANHCPGAAIFIFDVPPKKDGSKSMRYLHTGDFRASRVHSEHPLIKPPNHFDIVYLDDTYCKPSHTFPSQISILNCINDLCVKLLKGDTVAQIVSGNPLKDFVLVHKRQTVDRPQTGLNKWLNHKSKAPKFLIVVGSYLIGKERIILKVAESLNSKIYVTTKYISIINEIRKMKIYNCQSNDTLTSRLTTNPSMANVHVVQMNQLSPEYLNDLLIKYKEIFSDIIAIRPTGWTHRKPSGNSFKVNNLQPKYVSSNITIVPIPYSEHSSFEELKMFIQSINVSKVIPTVNVRDVTRLNELFKSWNPTVQ
ncbi:DNA repair metallo-beta-lactamase-domain-containing protein [Globomyces pollinis-pini]|nr:DNA repair metallo-beta-lactamase-domain-containing protein [Globomyces pollinis-pini]